MWWTDWPGLRRAMLLDWFKSDWHYTISNIQCSVNHFSVFLLSLQLSHRSCSRRGWHYGVHHAEAFGQNPVPRPETGRVPGSAWVAQHVRHRMLWGSLDETSRPCQRAGGAEGGGGRAAEWSSGTKTHLPDLWRRMFVINPDLTETGHCVIGFQIVGLKCEFVTALHWSAVTNLQTIVCRHLLLIIKLINKMLPGLRGIMEKTTKTKQKCSLRAEVPPDIFYLGHVPVSWSPAFMFVQSLSCWSYLFG